MMVQKITKAQKMDLVQKYKWRLGELEEKQEIKDYLRWLAMSPDDKVMLRKMWEDYYVAVRSSPTAKRFWQIKTNLLSGRVAVVKDLVRQQRDARDSIGMPPFIDPNVFDFNDVYVNYRIIKKKLEDLSDPMYSQSELLSAFGEGEGGTKNEKDPFGD